MKIIGILFIILYSFNINVEAHSGSLLQVIINNVPFFGALLLVIISYSKKIIKIIANFITRKKEKD